LPDIGLWIEAIGVWILGFTADYASSLQDLSLGYHEVGLLGRFYLKSTTPALSALIIMAIIDSLFVGGLTYYYYAIHAPSTWLILPAVAAGIAHGAAGIWNGLLPYWKSAPTTPMKS
jgi:hypothetical protein